MQSLRLRDTDGYEICGITRDEFARRERRRIDLIKKARRDAARQARRTQITPPPIKHDPVELFEMPCGITCYRVRRAFHRPGIWGNETVVSLPWVSILRD